MRNVTVNSIGEYIREQREQARISMRQLAQAAGVSNPYLSQIERGLRKPSADILQQIAKGLRISAEALYVQAGILEDREADSGVRSALLADPQLSERQKQVLTEIYESFRRENAAAAEAAQAAAEAESSADAGARAPDAGGGSGPDGSPFPDDSGHVNDSSLVDDSGHVNDTAGRADDTSSHANDTSRNAEDNSDQTVPPIR